MDFGKGVEERMMLCAEEREVVGVEEEVVNVMGVLEVMASRNASRGSVELLILFL